MKQQQSRAGTEGVLGWVRTLQCNRGARDGEGRFWVEGVRQFVQACDAGFSFDTIVLSRVLLKSSLADMLARRLRKSPGVRTVRVTPEAFRSVSITERASGIGAIVRQRWTPLERVDPNRGVCWLVVEDLRSAGNLGTILRTAEAAGVGGVIFLSRRVDPFDPAVVRASMGGLFHLPLIRTTAEHLRRWSRQRGVRLVGLSPDAGRLWTEVRTPGPTVIVVGEERAGLSKGIMDVCDERVRLPMAGRADSLNVAVAAGVMVYEMVRRRGLAECGRGGCAPGAGT